MKLVRLLRGALLGSAFYAAEVAADPMPQDRATARALFDEGRQLAHVGQYTEACPKFEESQRLDAGIGTLFNLADCYEHIGRIAAAWSNFLEVVDQARRSGQTERETIARERAGRLAPHLAHLTFGRVETAGSLQLKLDGTALGQGVLGAGLPVDPGTHTVEAVGAGKKPWSTKIEVADGAAVTVTVPVLDDDPGPSAVRSTPSLEPSRDGQQQLVAGVVRSSQGPPETRRSWQRPVAMGVTGLGVVGLGVAAFLGLRARSQWSDAQPLCPQGNCTSHGYSLWNDSKTTATYATVAFALGAAVAAGGVALWITAPAPHAQVGIGPGDVALKTEF
jgi:hypothetical protein